MSYYADSSYSHQSHHHHHHRSSSSYLAPSGADSQLWQYFSAVDTNRSGVLSLGELRNALVNGNWTKFDLDTVKMLMDMFDSERTGTISFDDFTRLWQYIADWQRVFRRFDRDQSGTIERRELSEALQSFGYRLSPQLLSLIQHKYASGADSAYGPAPGISFDRFVRACVAIKTLTEGFERFDTNRDGLVLISYDDFMKIALRAP